MTKNLNNPSALRAQIVELRQEIAETTRQFQIARTRGQSEQAKQLLRTRSDLIRQLFQRQSELLATIRANATEADPSVDPASDSTVVCT